MFGLVGVKLLRYALIVSLESILRNTFHTKYLNVDTIAAGIGILNLLEVLLVHLTKMDLQTWK